MRILMALIPRSNTSISTNEDGSNVVQVTPPKIVLTEEEYKIDQIIERDFFPDMERLRLRTEYQSALDENDLERLRDIQEKWGKMIANESKSDVNEKEHIQHQDIEGLDEFLSKFTSEDNVSFEQIVAETRAKLRQKYWWLFQAQQDAKDASILPSDEAVFAALKSKDSSLMIMNAWKYTPKNALMYTPDSAPLTPEELADLHKGKPIINHANTRLNRDHSKKIELLSQALLTAKSKTRTDSDKLGIDGKPAEVVTSSEYSLLSTPTPVPGAGESPFMTWGEIGATPLIMDTPGPSFKIPETPVREELLMKLDADNINKRKQAMKSQSGSTKGRSSKTPLTPSQRLQLLSPAAKLLACKSGLATPSPLRGGNTPRLTPLASPFDTRSSNTPVGKSKRQNDSTPSITDNLLKFVDK